MDDIDAAQRELAGILVTSIHHTSMRLHVMIRQ